MHLDPDTCYRAMVTHDPRFDGRFFVAVRTTKIYCRPVCRVKVPKRENCSFVASAAMAESLGYRPCLRCRPELAPGNASIDSRHRIAQAAASLIEDGLLADVGIEGLARRLGIQSRHLRRVFCSEFGVSPISFAQTHRLLLAKRLLTDTTLTMTEVAFAAGFNSLRRFNALLQERYRLTPQQIRKTPRSKLRPDHLTFDLRFLPPYDWESLIGFLGARTISGVEEASSTSYRRVARLLHGGTEHLGWVEITPDLTRNTMRITASASLAKVIPPLLARLKCLLDLSCDPTQIGLGLGRIAVSKPGLRVPGAFDGFEIAIRAILGQQVSVAAARTLAGRFAAAFGTPVDTPFESLSLAFPTAQTVAALNLEDISRLGILPARARTIVGLATAAASGSITLSPGSAVDATVQNLKTIPGIGEWTAQYIAMRALAWPDAFPHTDLGVMRAMGERNPKHILAAAEPWRPWRAYAAMHLWTTGSFNATTH